MITLDLHQLFKADPKSTKVPRLVFDWVTEREKMFPEMEYQIRFCSYEGQEEAIPHLLKYERYYGPSLLRLRDVSFPFSNCVWTVRIIGNQDDAIAASGLMPLLKSKDPRIEVITALEGKHLTLRGYKRKNPVLSSEDDMVDIKHDRNINDEWKFRGTAQEFMEKIVKPILD